MLRPPMIVHMSNFNHYSKIDGEEKGFKMSSSLNWGMSNEWYKYINIQLFGWL